MGIICISEVVDILPAILIPACDSSSLAFHMIHSAYKLNDDLLITKIKSFSTAFRLTLFVLNTYSDF